jgi:hypothetical protein
MTRRKKFKKRSNARHALSAPGPRDRSLLSDILAKRNDWMPETPLTEPLKRSDMPSSDQCQFYLAATSRGCPGAGSRQPLDALDPSFRKGVGWFKLGGEGLSQGSDFVIGMQRPPPEIVPGSDRRFVAVNPETYRGDATRDVAEHQEFWEEQINIRPFSMEFVKAAAIWASLGIKISLEQTAFMMRMKSVDAETSEAINAALWCAFNTSRYPIDMETAAFVLAAFLHADPLRRHLVSKDEFVEPYGAATVYALLKVYREKK